MSRPRTAEVGTAPVLLFASAADAPRTRRLNDAFTALIALVVLVLAGWAAERHAPVDDWLAGVVVDAPGWLTTIARGLYAAGGLYALGLMLTIAARGGRRAIRRDMVVAVTATVVLGVISGRLAGGQWPDLLPEFIDPGDPLTYPEFRIFLLVSVVTTAAPHLTAPLRRTGRRVLIGAASAAVVLGVAGVTGIIGALAAGRLVASVVHLVYGSPAGLPSVPRLEAALRGLGVTDASVELLPEQPVGVALARARRGDGAEYFVKIYGRDAADAELAAKTWRSVWYREGAGTLSLSGLQQAEHEAVVTLLAERAGVGVPHMEVVGQDVDGNAFLVSAWCTDPDLATVPEPDDDRLDQVWAAVLALHRAGLSHGRIRPEAVLFGASGVTLTDLSDGRISPDGRRVGADLAATLASLTVVVGADRAVASMVRSVDPDRVEHTLPFLQEAVLLPEVRRALHDVADLDDLVADLTGRLDLERPPLARIRRVRLTDVVLLVFGVFAVNAIIGQITEVGVDVLLDELGSASAGWLVATFLLALLGYLGDVISLRAAIPQPVPTGPTVLLRSAKSFVGLAVPTTAGRVALDIRYFQKLGVPTATALVQGPVISFLGFLAEVMLLLLGASAIGESIELDRLERDSLDIVLFVVVGVVALGLVLVFALPKLRAIVLPPLRQAATSATDVVRHPRRVALMFGGQLYEKLIGGLALAATLAAFGQHLPFAAVVFVSVGTGLLAGLAPVPGGIGVAEATMTALLTTAGVPPESAFPVAITFRFVTSYLPPFLGWFSLRWLTSNGYL